MKKIFLLSTLLVSCILFGQSQNDKKVFLDSLNEETVEGEHVSYRIIKDYKIKKKDFIVENYYNSGLLKMKGIYKDKEAKIKNGDFTFYYENGNKKLENHFEKNIIIGLFTEWYENGNKKSEGKHIDANDLNHDFEIINYWDENNIQTVILGEGLCKEKTKYSEISGIIKNGRKHDIWIGKDISKNITFEEVYQNGKLISGKSTNLNGIIYNYDEIFIETSPIKGQANLINFIEKNIPKQNVNQNIKVKILLRLIINSNGKLKEIILYKNVDEYLEDLAIEAVKNYKEDWIPAKYRGINVTGKIILPIVFDLKKG